MKYTIQRALNTQRGIITQYLSWCAGWCVATSNPVSANNPKELAEIAKKLERDNPNYPLSAGQIVGPKDGRYNLFTGDRIRYV